MKEFWDEKYSKKNYHYGTEPNNFFREYIDKIKNKKIKILFPGDGEGRNSVYAAKIGHDVTAFDQSVEGCNKALKLALNENVNINYQLCDILDFNSEIKFDLIVFIYLHLPKSIRNQAHKKMIDLLKPNGIIIMEAFNKNQINNDSGGPKNIDMLYSTQILKNDFNDLKIEYIEEKSILLNESEHHSGKADIIRMLAKNQ